MSTEKTGELGSRSQLHVLELMAATALGIYLCYQMAQPFVPALTWALALAVLFLPVHRWLKSRVKRSNVAASVSVVTIGLIVVVPATFLGHRPDSHQAQCQQQSDPAAMETMTTD